MVLVKIIVGLSDKGMSRKVHDVESVKRFFRGRVDAGHGYEATVFLDGRMEEAFIFECVDMSDYLVSHDSVEGLARSVRDVFDRRSIPVVRVEGGIDYVY